MNDPKIPVLSLLPAETFWRIVVRCPYCDKLHRHGGGDLSGEPNLGHRGAECGRGSYTMFLDKNAMNEDARKCIAKATKLLAEEKHIEAMEEIAHLG